MTNVFFSVVITVYNKEQFIETTLKSVLNQSYKNFEVIVVNDGSTDNSLNVIESFSDERITIHTIDNSGASRARNKGINEAKQEFIALLDGDDIWLESYLETINSAINKYPEEYIFTTAIAQKYADKIVPVTYSFKEKKEFNLLNYFEASLDYGILSSSSIVFHKGILSKTGLFDASIKSGQDIDLWIRFGIHYKVLFINQVLVHYRYDQKSLSNTTYNLKHKPNYNKYEVEEKTNSSLKKYLDLNRYSLAILSKIQSDDYHYNFFSKKIDLRNLTLRQRILLRSPKWLLIILLKIKSLKGEKLYYLENRSLKTE